MVKILNTGFFKKRVCVETNTSSENKDNSVCARNKEKVDNQDAVTKSSGKINYAKNLEPQIKETIAFLEHADLQNLAHLANNAVNNATRDKFTVAVVGEFSRGKSALINRLFGQPLLPEGNLPTTAMLTRIRYSTNNRLVHVNAQGKPGQPLLLSAQAWNELVVNNNVKSSPKGFVAVGLNDIWLKNNKLEIVDTPGAGDLDEYRAKQIGDILMRCDGAIIAIKADQPLSESERLFIQQRVIGRRTPFVMLVINKLDLINKNERSGVVEYVIEKLKEWNMNIPVFVGGDVEFPDETYKSITGIDKVKKAIETWSNDSRRRELTEKWISGRMTEILCMAEDALADRLTLFSNDEEKRREAIDAKRQALKHMSLGWGNLEIGLMERANKCYELFCKNIEGMTDEIIERLQFEIGHATDLPKWWKEDYPYRLKKELANMSIALNNIVVQQARQDAVWFNGELDKNFKSVVSVGELCVAEKKKMESFTSENKVEVEDATKQLNKMRLGTVALSITGAIILSATGLGILSLVATMGVGTGAAILTGNIFKKRIEEQRDALKKCISSDVPQVVMRATNDSENRVKAIYNDLIVEAHKKQNAWMQTQQQLIEQSIKPIDSSIKDSLESLLAKVHGLKRNYK